MELMEFESRRNIKPGDIFRAYMSAAAASGSGIALGDGTPDIDQILAAANALERQPAAGSGAESSKESELFRGHEAFAARTGAPYHWGASLQQPPFMNKRHADERDPELMETFQVGVVDAIHNALSKEALIKKLIIPFNGNFESKHAVSHWEWQKNTALLELEQRNQQLQHRLREAAKQVAEAQSRAQHDRKLLAEALQKGKGELYLINRSEIMRAHLIEKKQVIARRRVLNMTLSLWQRFCQDCRKKRILKKSEVLWYRLMLMKWFDGIVHGYQRIKNSRQLKTRVQRHWVKNSLGHCFRSWASHSSERMELKEKVMAFARSWAIYRLRVAYKGWREWCSIVGWKQVQQKRAASVWSFSYLRKGWRGWDQYVIIAKEMSSSAECLLFQRLIGGPFSAWHKFVCLKMNRSKQLALCNKQSESSLRQVVFDIWHEKMSLLLVIRERLGHFMERCQKRFQQLILKKWYQLSLRKWYLRRVGQLLKVKVQVCSKRWALIELRRRWTRIKMVQRSLALRMGRVRRAVFLRWREEVQYQKDSKWSVVQIQKRVKHQWQRRLISSWKLYTVESRNVAVFIEAKELTAKNLLLKSELGGVERVQHQLENLVLELRNENAKIVHCAETAISRTPVWTSGFLDVELRWTTPSFTWLPPACAGHTTVSLPGNHSKYPHCRIICFGGYNGESYSSDIHILDTDDMQWKSPAPTAAEGSVIPPGMQTHTACPFGTNKMVLFGGYDGAREFSELSLLEISDDSMACEWSQLHCVVGAKPGPVCQHTSCMYEDGRYMVVFGGYRSEEGLLNELWVLDLQWLNWTSPEYFGTPPAPCRGHSAAVVGTKMYCFGGYNGREHLADLHSLDMETMTWECIEGEGQAPTPRRHHSLSVVGQHLVIYGGYNGQEYLGDVFSFDTVHRSWKQWPDRETQLPLGEVGQGGQVYRRSMHTMVKAGQRLVIFGGVHEWGALQDMVFLENAAATDGLQLQASLFEELQKATILQTKVTEYEKVLGEKTLELVKAETTLENLRSTLEVESEKRKKAVKGHRVLTKKLQKARSTSDS